jgi:hypothetical protein
VTRPVPQARIPVGVVVERAKGSSPWTDFLWRPIAVLPGEPDTAPWTTLAEGSERTTFYAGGVEIELYRSEADRYRDNLASKAPALWVVLRPTGATPPYQLLTVTADPAEGEAFTDAGNDLVEPVPMPDSIHAVVAAFVEEYHVKKTFVKRKRERANPDAFARRAPASRKGRDE